jgi:hypothetical protein
MLLVAAPLEVRRVNISQRESTGFDQLRGAAGETEDRIPWTGA